VRTDIVVRSKTTATVCPPTSEFPVPTAHRGEAPPGRPTPQCEGKGGLPYKND